MPCSVPPRRLLTVQLLPPSVGSNAFFPAPWLIPSSRRKLAPKPSGPLYGARLVDVLALLPKIAISALICATLRQKALEILLHSRNSRPIKKARLFSEPGQRVTAICHWSPPYC